MPKVIFKYPQQNKIYKPLIDAVNQLCEDYGKGLNCVSGYRSSEEQRLLAQQILKQNPTHYFKNDRVYDFEGRCIVGAPGSSNHNFCIAMDIEDKWFKVLKATELAKYGLFLPMSYEPWHVELIATKGISKLDKTFIRDGTLKGVKKDMTVKDFQAMTGLFEDGIAGPITQAKAKEVLKICQKILKNDFETAEEVVIATQNNPSMWIQKLNEVKYLKEYTMNIYKKMKGE